MSGGHDAWSFIEEFRVPPAPEADGRKAWVAIETFTDAWKAVVGRSLARFPELIEKWDELLSAIDRDPLRDDWRSFRPLRRDREVDWSDWLGVVVRDLLQIANELPTLPGWRPTGEPFSQFKKSALSTEPWIGVGCPGVGDEEPFGTAGQRSMHFGLTWWESEHALAYLRFDPNWRVLDAWKRGQPQVRPFRNSWGSYLVTEPSPDLRQDFARLFAELGAALSRPA
ncbi:MAG: hypothetical protein HYY06_12690 [Deltaproteobacteria bacterium]|nr:hypothetical protein [Deltaproteobacteria bacterium]